MDKVEYFDGKSPVPVIGNLISGGDSIEFRPDNNSSSETGIFTVKYNEIVRIEKFRDSSIVVIQDDRYHSKKLVLYNTGLITEIEARYYREKSFFIKAAHEFHTSGWFKLLALAAVIVPVFLTLIYVGFSQIYKLIPAGYDHKIGKRSYQLLKGNFKECQGEKGLKVIHKIKNTISDNSSITVSVLDSPIVNAFALPGGQVVFFKGLIDQAGTPEELYAVMAHEIGHEELRHSMQQLTRSLGVMFLSSVIIGGALEGLETLENVSEMVNILLVMKYSRGFEKEADDYAIKVLQDKQISLQGFIDFFIKISDESPEFMKKSTMLEWISSHPADQKRIENIKNALTLKKYKSRKLLTGKEMLDLKNICSVQ